MLLLPPESKTQAYLLQVNYSQPGKNHFEYGTVIEEAVSLAEASFLEVAHVRTVNLKRISPATLIGRGVVDEIAIWLKSNNVGVIFINTQLSPLHQRNLERRLKCKVLDRTTLILEIFGLRAITREGKLQVELASLIYQKTRLVRLWTHLERQRGGFGFLAGPGESQIELDRRMIQKRIEKIQRALEGVKKTRALHRARRQSRALPIIALVGYTNAGKSTLFNRLTHAQALVKDMVFATLDPMMRTMTLPSATRAILSDTVGFIADLPPELIAAFHATLEEVIHADIILHVRDVSHIDHTAQARAVYEVLQKLGIGTEAKILEVFNKVDRIDAWEDPPAPSPDYEHVKISATTGEGCDALKAKIDSLLDDKVRVRKVMIPGENTTLIQWIYGHTKVISVKEKKGALEFTLKARPAHQAMLETMIARKLS